MPKWVNWGLPVITALSYGLLVLWFGPQVQAAADGLMPFDLRATGYGPEDARAFLTALTPAGREVYLGPVRINDTVFPVLFTLTLWLPLRGKALWWFAPALAYGLLDLAENWAVAGLLRAGPAVAEGAVAWASGLTIAKFAAVTVAIGLAALGLWQAWRAR